MRRIPLNKISSRHRIELDLRKKLKAELMKEQLETVGYIYCMTCRRRPDWRGISLSHIIPLGRGGKTTKENTIIECYPCHIKYEKKPELRAEELKTYWD